ncbi:MAG: accessory factor UbiK family protein, partial [Nitrospirota bacterium]
MTDGPNRFFDEFAKLMTDAAGVAQAMRREAETVFHAQSERMLNNLDLVKRDDFDAVK